MFVHIETYNFDWQISEHWNVNILKTKNKIYKNIIKIQEVENILLSI